MVKTKSQERKLNVCMYCLRKLNWCNINQYSDKDRSIIRNNFDLKDFLKNIQKILSILKIILMIK